MTMTHTTFDTLARQGSPFGSAGAFTVAKSAGHGDRFDEFHATASNPHGDHFDSGFSPAVADEAHGKLYDLFGVPRDSDAHGQRWDEFDWREMPALHGQHFDTGFATPIAGEGEHGTTWFDVFRGGATQARYIFNGIDHEGTVVDVSPEYATVKARDGQMHEVTLQQFLAYRTPNEQQAGPSIPASDAEAPSARSSDAHGAFEGQRQDVSPALVDGAPIEAIPQGQARQERSDLLGGLMDTFDHVKTAAAEVVDVAKAEAFTAQHRVLSENVSGLDKGTPVQFKHQGTIGAGTITKPNSKPGFHQVAVGQSWHPSSGFGKLRGTHDLPHAAITHAQTMAAKTASADVDVAKGTTLGMWNQPACPGCGSTSTIKHDGGPAHGLVTCQGCGKVREPALPKPSVGKTLADELADVFKDVGISETAILGTPNQTGIDVPVRAHPSTDHHSAVDQPKVCPHCGKPLADEDHQSEQGAPSRKDKQGSSDEFDTVESHKCFAGTLDLLKSLVAA